MSALPTEMRSRRIGGGKIVLLVMLGICVNTTWTVLVVRFLDRVSAAAEPLAAVQLPPSPTTKPAGLPRCVTPTPRQWNQQGFFETFATAEQVVPMVCLPDPVDWWHAEGKDPEKSKPFNDHRWQSYLLNKHGLDVFIQVDPYKTRRGKLSGLPKAVAAPTFADPVLRRAFIADVLQRARLYQPRYLCLAMEINAYYEENADDFDHFVSLFKEARKQVKAIAPDTVVFVSFQYEQLLGLYGGQGHLPKHEPHWELFKQFEPEIDAIGISSYPMKTFSPPTYPDPKDFPADYYKRIAKHTDKPIVFAELGWPSDPKYGGSPEKQAAFLQRFPSLIEGLDVRLVNYNFLFDARGFGAVFESMGFIDAKGVVKPALQVWRGM